ncbi:DNA-binding domain-containing protein [Cobetia sp. 1AS1]|uniref:DNA-binding domain-containing protein n=1 Tax=Cobetia sp. 1AS1 TaxID=3040016 RepID=UPI00244C43B5|nr:DNA-binding domain-containing protein [Cobetia sp. 1AS1]MDH2295018.1 DNA-binding domain-containing protein [Cobetia sp. 1AS1]
MTSLERHASAERQPDWQRAFIEALTQPDAALLGIEAGHQQRLDVYRNNVWASLISALEEAYPVTRQVVGERFFAALAHDHSRQHLPRSPLMMEYGAGLAETLHATLTTLVETRQVSAAQLPFYAVDLARFEAARLVAYHAADAEALVPTQLAGLPPAAVMELRFSAHPAACLLHLEHAVLEIWQRHQHADATLEGLAIARPERILITRPALEVQVTVLCEAAALLLELLLAGQTLADAAARLADAHPEQELGPLLAPLLASGAFRAPT